MKPRLSTDKHFKTTIMIKCIDLTKIINSIDCPKFMILA